MTRFKNLTAYELHKHLVNEYILTTKGTTKLLTRDTSKDKRDFDVIREHHQFLWNDHPIDSWEKQLAKKYYDKLFKEYCICDLSRYSENKIALRWRVEQEVVTGKGQFTCGSKKCTEKENLRSWEVNFAYKENGEHKNALVKLRLCEPCSAKLNHHTKKREIKRLKKSGKRKSSGKKSNSDKDKNTAVSEEDKEGNQVEGTQSDNPSTSTEGQSTVDSEPWKKANVSEEKSRDEEFEEYLEDLLL